MSGRVAVDFSEPEKDSISGTTTLIREREHPQRKWKKVYGSRDDALKELVALGLAYEQPEVLPQRRTTIYTEIVSNPDAIVDPEELISRGFTEVENLSPE